jgi:PAS domain S-box-containing protein
MLERTVSGISAAVDRGLALEEALHIISIVRQHLTRLSLRAVAEQIPGAVAAVETYTGLLDLSVERLGAYYYGKLGASLEENRRFRLLVENAHDGVLTTDRDDRITYANAAAAHLLGAAAPDELLGRLSMSLYREQDISRFRDEIWPILRQQGFWRTQMWLVRLDGSQVLTEFVTFFVRNDEGKSEGLGAVLRDITAEHEAMLQREAFQNEIIQAQEQVLRELSAPLIPLNETTMVLPLIGDLDEARMQHITQTLLGDIAASRTQVLIVDITGVPTVTPSGGNELLRTAQAVRLLGAELVLTGIQAEVAQTLIVLGIDLGGIVTRASLQSGIAYALGRRQ